MTRQLQIRVYRNRELCHTLSLAASLQIGRQRPGEPAPFHFDAAASRLVVAPMNDKLVSREHLLLAVVPMDQEREDSPQVRIRNLSRKRSAFVDCHGKLGPQESVVLPTPLLVTFEDFAIRVEQPASGTWEVRSLEHQTLAPGRYDAAGGASLIAQRSILQASEGTDYTPEKLLHWLGEMMGVLQSAAGASDFLTQAVDAVDRIVGLDAMTALQYEKGNWSVVVAKDRREDQAGADARSPSHTILREVLERKCTVYHLPAGAQAAASLQGVKALVASPILDAAGNVIGALYGARYSQEGRQLPQISALEATMVEVIACSAAAGIAREVQQQKALQARIQFEQFFTPQLARELESNPHMLEGQDAEISVLFCDIVGFSAISQRIGSRRTMDWISDVMDQLSVAVLDHEGVVVDYLGDELMAMWGAPKPQADHAMKAALAAGDLMRCKQAIDEKWCDKIGAPIGFRIGICSGMASVGNTGSLRRLKYGPLGTTVNLASRLQNAAKQFGVQQLISQSTASGLDAGSGLKLRLLGTARFVNIPTPVEVYELGPQSDESFCRLADLFTRVIRAVQDAKIDQARQSLELLLKQFPADVPAQMLSSRLGSGEQIDANCIWRFDTK